MALVFGLFDLNMDLRKSKPHLKLGFPDDWCPGQEILACSPARMKELQKTPWWYRDMNTLYLLVHHCWHEVWKDKKHTRTFCCDFKQLNLVYPLKKCVQSIYYLFSPITTNHHKVISESCTVATPGCRDSVVNRQYRGCAAACHLNVGIDQ